jgi:hypothetical protein
MLHDMNNNILPGLFLVGAILHGQCRCCMHEWVAKHVAYLFHCYVSWSLVILYSVSQLHFIPYTSARYSHGMSVLESFWL